MVEGDCADRRASFSSAFPRIVRLEIGISYEVQKKKKSLNAHHAVQNLRTLLRSFVDVPCCLMHGYE